MIENSQLLTFSKGIRKKKIFAKHLSQTLWFELNWKSSIEKSGSIPTQPVFLVMLSLSQFLSDNLLENMDFLCTDLLFLILFNLRWFDSIFIRLHDCTSFLY